MSMTWAATKANHVFHVAGKYRTSVCSAVRDCDFFACVRDCHGGERGAKHTTALIIRSSHPSALIIRSSHCHMPHHMSHHMPHHIKEQGRGMGPPNTPCGWS